MTNSNLSSPNLNLRIAVKSIQPILSITYCAKIVCAMYLEEMK